VKVFKHFVAASCSGLRHGKYSRNVTGGEFATSAATKSCMTRVITNCWVASESKL